MEREPLGNTSDGRSEILDWLWIGDKKSAICVVNSDAAICRVLNVVGGGVPSDEYLSKLRALSAAPAEEKLYLMTPMCDYGRDRLETDKHIQKALRFIVAARNANEKLLVHCRSGINRSVTIVLLYLVWIEKWSLKEALELVSSKRPQANPHPDYIGQLREIDGFPLQRLPTLCLHLVLASCSEKSLRAFRCTFRGATELVHLAFQSSFGASAIIVQRIWKRRTLMLHFLSHLLNQEERGAVLQELMGTILNRNTILSEALQLHAKFASRIEMYEDERSLSKLFRARPVLTRDFLDFLLDCSYLKDRLRVSHALVESIGLFDMQMDDQFRPTLASSLLIRRLYPHLVETISIYSQRQNRIASGTERLNNQLLVLRASKNTLDVDFLADCGDRFILLCGLGSEIIRLSILIKAYCKRCTFWTSSVMRSTSRA